MELAQQLDQQVRWQVYDSTMRSGLPPSVAQVAAETGLAVDAVRESFERLATARILVLQEDEEILMANPFSAVPTPFHVKAGEVEAYGNCIWDALGIPAMLGADGVVSCSCGDCGAAMEVRVTKGEVIGAGLMHFAIPARLWWKDIVYN